MTKSYIWSLSARLSHIVMIVTFALCYFCGGKIHFISGAIFGVAVIFRIIWGFIGTKHSRFWEFNFKGILDYFASFFHQKLRFVGHNPASSIAIILMLIFGLVIFYSGLLLLGSGGTGFFAFYYERFSEIQWAKNLHEIAVNAMLFVVIAHTLGALIDKFWHKNDSIDSMITGYKLTPNDENIIPSKAQNIFNALWIGAILATGLYMLTPKNYVLAQNIKPIDYKAQNANFVKECASCHTLYAPFLLPKKSWEIMMSDLENHFGDDASINKALNDEITAFLVANALESKDTKITAKLKAAQKEGDIAITANEYWKKKHRKIKDEIFAKPEIKSKANCAACHEKIEEGIIHKSLIKRDLLKKA